METRLQKFERLVVALKRSPTIEICEEVGQVLVQRTMGAYYLDLLRETTKTALLQAAVHGEEISERARLILRAEKRT